MKKLSNQYSFSKYLITVAVMYCGPLSALVDYSESKSFQPRKSAARSTKKVSSKSTSSTISVSKNSQRPSYARSGFLSASLNYENRDINLGQYRGNISSLELSTHFETAYNIFLDASYSQGKIADSFYEDSSAQTGEAFEKGNPKVILGFNWLEFGAPQEAAHIDLLFGMSLGQDKSNFATQRNDKIIGIATAKRFYDFALGLGYQMIITGSSDEKELSIGNISKLSASLGWVISSDIRFMLEANSYSIGRSVDKSSFKLEEKTKVSVISPELILGISPIFDLSLGAHFSSRRLVNDKLLEAKLWNIDGFYGNSLYVKMNLNL